MNTLQNIYDKLAKYKTELVSQQIELSLLADIKAEAKKVDAQLQTLADQTDSIFLSLEKTYKLSTGLLTINENIKEQEEKVKKARIDLANLMDNKALIEKERAKLKSQVQGELKALSDRNKNIETIYIKTNAAYKSLIQARTKIYAEANAMGADISAEMKNVNRTIQDTDIATDESYKSYYKEFGALYSKAYDIAEKSK
jgi:DNA repair exonuclease SbcCD ATPase subunit